ncbi:hypothetical protein MP228_001730 [Amoeboaphelidium protococcarum]|nr:hypothetical protein MP228_001730 [Amoeboaphelidium protococcarum]
MSAQSIFKQLQQIIGQNQNLNAQFNVVASLVYAVFVHAGFRRADSQLDNAVAIPASVVDGATMAEFNLRHDQSSMSFEVRLVRMSNQIMIHATTLEQDQLYTVNVRQSELFPSDRYSTLSGQDIQQMTFPQFMNLFNERKLDDFLHQIKAELIGKLIPGLGKEGYEQSSSTQNQQREDSRVGGRPERSDDPLRISQQPGRGARPDYNRDVIPERVGQGYPYPRNPFSIGSQDVDPMASLLGPPSAGGGMFVGPGHPMFGQGPYSSPSSSGFGRPPLVGPSGQRLPPGAIPPGARFDPIVPDLGRQPRPRPPRSGEPDNDELQPPGYGDMFF